jgi:hypothetical protein
MARFPVAPVVLAQKANHFHPKEPPIFCQHRILNFGASQYLALCRGMFFAEGLTEDSGEE